MTRGGGAARSQRMKRNWPLSNAQVLFVSVAASTAASVATLATAALWVRLVVGPIVGGLIWLSVYVWRKTRDTLGYFTTWAIEALMWGAFLGVLTWVSAVVEGSDDVAREALLGAGSGVLVVFGWALLLIPARGLLVALRVLVRRMRQRRYKAGTRAVEARTVKQRSGAKQGAPKRAPSAKHSKHKSKKK